MLPTLYTSQVGFPSGQRGGSQDPMRMLRRFESGTYHTASLTQLVECKTLNLVVMGSSPIGGISLFFKCKVTGFPSGQRGKRLLQ